MSPSTATSNPHSASGRRRAARAIALLGVVCCSVVPACEIDHRLLFHQPLRDDVGGDDAAGRGGAVDSGGGAAPNPEDAGQGGRPASATGGQSGDNSGDDDNAGTDDGSGDTTSTGGTSPTGGSPNGGTSPNGGGGRASTGGTSGGAPSAGAAPFLCPDLDGDSVPDCSQTLLRNATFDTSFAGSPNNWHVASGVTATWDSLDAMSSSSGSIVVTTSSAAGAGVDQCVPLQEGKSYEAYALMLLQAKTVNGLARMSEFFFPSSDCSGSFDRVVASAPEGTTNSWRTLHVPASPALKDGSLLLRLEVLKADGAISISVHFDSVLLLGK